MHGAEREDSESEAGSFPSQEEKKKAWVYPTLGLHIDSRVEP